MIYTHQRQLEYFKQVHPNPIPSHPSGYDEDLEDPPTTATRREVDQSREPLQRSTWEKSIHVFRFFFFTFLFQNGGKPKLKATWEQRNKKRKRGPNSSAMTLRKRVAKKIQGFHAENGREKKKAGSKRRQKNGKRVFVCLPRGKGDKRGGGGGERREERGGGYMRQHLFFFRFLTWSAALVAISNTSRTPSLVLAEHSR